MTIMNLDEALAVVRYLEYEGTAGWNREVYLYANEVIAERAKDAISVFHSVKNVDKS